MANKTPSFDTVFCAAIEILSAEDRAAYIARECAGNDDLRSRVEKLVAVHFRAGSFMECPVPQPVATAADSQPISERPGTVIGPYKLMEQIGEGGMGLVFVAEQQQPVRRKVALKIIKPGMDTRDVIARFEAERQALALMDHPNIARVLDAGATDSGRPYFVMELVKGVPITDYCDQYQLTPRERLELFVGVCHAVQHAHTKGVIHRDLKPSNVLIAPHDGKPVVKVIDFGVAKAVGQALTDKTIYTRISQMIGTPLYMSPEQAEINALDVDTRSDVYGLGVLLYELLTGTTPFDRERLHTAAFDEIRRIIREEEPPKPSARLTTLGEGLSVMSAKRKTDPGKLSSLFKGDLDWIVMKALEKDRTRRYDTASAFAADVNRFLNDELVEARPPSALYRFRKMARRNKAAMMTAALVAAALVLGIVGTTVGLFRAIDAEVDALAARDQEAEQRQLALNAAAEAQESEQRAKTEEKKSNLLRVEALALAEAEKVATQLATNQAKIAEEERQKANLARQEAEKNETRAEFGLYASHIASADREWKAGNVSLFYHHLKQCRPDFRGWEHDYLYTLANQNQQTLRGHSGPVMSVAFSPDGKRLASASGSGGDSFFGRPVARHRPGELKMWDAGTGQLLWSTNGKTGAINSLTFSPDGKHLASSSFGLATNTYEVILWDAATGKQIWTVPAGPWCVVFSPDGKRLAGSSRFGEGSNIQLWDAASGKALLTLGQTQGISVAFSPDGRRVAASASQGKAVKLWDLASGQELLILGGHELSPTVAFSPDGSRLATASKNKTVTLWDAATGQELQTFKGHNSGISSVAFSPNGKLLVSAGGQRQFKDGDATLKLWDTASGQEIQTLRGHVGGVTSVAFSPDGKRLASASHDKTVKLWEIGSRLDVLTIRAQAKTPTQMAFSPDGKRLASASDNNTVKVWDAASGKDHLTLSGHTSGVTSVVFSPDGKRLASGSGDKTVKLWDAASGKNLLTLPGHTSRITCVAFSRDGKLLASGSADKTAKLWDANTGEELVTLNGRGGFDSLVFSPDGKRVATATKGRPPELWDAQTGEQLLSFQGKIKGGSGIVAFSPDSKLLASGSGDQTVKLWDAASGKDLLTLKGHTGDLLSVAFCPDGKSLATASNDKTVKLFDAANGKVIWTRPHTSAAKSIAFSPDGRRLAIAFGDPPAFQKSTLPATVEVQIWDASIGQELRTLRVDSAVLHLAFSPDGKRLVGATAKDILIWDASRSMEELEQK